MAGMYNEFQCNVCKARLTTHSQSATAFAPPRCPTPGCRGAMLRIGSSPVAPPPASGAAYDRFVANRTAALNAISAAEVPIHSGAGSTTVGTVSFEAFENSALGVIILRIAVNLRAAVEVRFPLALLVRNPGGPSDWGVLPPFPAYKSSPESWLVISRSDGPIANLAGPTLSSAPPMPPSIRIGMKLGNHAFGLIHLIAGHLANLRTFIGTMNQSTSPTDAERAIDETFRSFQGVQAGIMEQFSASKLKLINFDSPAKWLIVSDTNTLLVARGLSPATLSVTTLYTADAVNLRGVTVWRRKVGR